MHLIWIFRTNTFTAYLIALRNCCSSLSCCWGEEEEEVEEGDNDVYNREAAEWLINVQKTHSTVAGNHGHFFAYILFDSSFCFWKRNDVLLSLIMHKTLLITVTFIYLMPNYFP